MSKRLQANISSELMHNHVPTEPVDGHQVPTEPDDDHNAIRHFEDCNGHPVVFSLGNDGNLYMLLSHSLTPGAWEQHNLTEKITSPKSWVSRYDVRQTEENKLELVIVLYDDGVAEDKSPYQVFVSQPFHVDVTDHDPEYWATFSDQWMEIDVRRLKFWNYRFFIKSAGKSDDQSTWYVDSKDEQKLIQGQNEWPMSPDKKTDRTDIYHVELVESEGEYPRFLLCANRPIGELPGQPANVPSASQDAYVLIDCDPSIEDALEKQTPCELDKYFDESRLSVSTRKRDYQWMGFGSLYGKEGMFCLLRYTGTIDYSDMYGIRWVPFEDKEQGTTERRVPEGETLDNPPPTGASAGAEYKETHFERVLLKSEPDTVNRLATFNAVHGSNEEWRTTDLFVGGKGGLWAYPSVTTKSRPVEVVREKEMPGEPDDLVITKSINDRYAIFFTTWEGSVNSLYVVEYDRHTDEARAPSLIERNFQQFAVCPEKRRDHLSVMVVKGNHLFHHQQDPTTRAWDEQRVELPNVDTYTEFESYTTRIQLTDDTGEPLSRTEVQIKGSSLSKAIINGHHLNVERDHPVTVQTDLAGELHIIAPTRHLGSPDYEVTADGYTGAVEMCPSEIPMKRLAEKSDEELTAAASSRGEEKVLKDLRKMAKAQLQKGKPNAKRSLSGYSETQTALHKERPVFPGERGFPVTAAALPSDGIRISIRNGVLVSDDEKRRLKSTEEQVAQSDVFSDIAASFEEGWHWLEKQGDELRDDCEIIFQEIREGDWKGAIRATFKFAGRIITFPIRFVGEIVKTIVTIQSKILAWEVGTIIAFLGRTFNWGAVGEMATAIRPAFDSLFEYGEQKIRSERDQVDKALGNLSEQITEMKNWIGGSGKKLLQTRQNHTEMLSKTRRDIRKDIDELATKDDAIPHAQETARHPIMTWALQHMSNNPQTTDDGVTELFNQDGVAAGLVDEMMSSMEMIVTEVEEYLENNPDVDLERDLLNLAKDLRNADSIEQALEAGVLDVAETAIDLIRIIIHTVLDLLERFVEQYETILDQEMELPIPVLSRIVTSVSGFEKASLGNVISLIVAVPSVFMMSKMESVDTGSDELSYGMNTLKKGFQKSGQDNFFISMDEILRPSLKREQYVASNYAMSETGETYHNYGGFIGSAAGLASAITNLFGAMEDFASKKTPDFGAALGVISPVAAMVTRAFTFPISEVKDRRTGQSPGEVDAFNKWLVSTGFNLVHVVFAGLLAGYWIDLRDQWKGKGKGPEDAKEAWGQDTGVGYVKFAHGFLFLAELVVAIYTFIKYVEEEEKEIGDDVEALKLHVRDQLEQGGLKETEIKRFMQRIVDQGDALIWFNRIEQGAGGFYLLGRFGDEILMFLRQRDPDPETKAVIEAFEAAFKGIHSVAAISQSGVEIANTICSEAWDLPHHNYHFWD